jgi:DNA-binding XRE family transcriptional regulator
MMSDPTITTAGPAGLDPDLDPANFEANFLSIELSPTGEGQEVVNNGMGWSLSGLIHGLKKRREELGLTIEEASRRSELNVATLSRLENGHIRNPTLDTIFRYALAMDLLITLSTEEVEPEYRWGSELSPLPPGPGAA